MNARPKPPAISAADVPPEWIATVREIIAREAPAVRAGEGCTIEVQSINTGEFQSLAMPTGATEFTTSAERDAVLEQLIKG